ncbi:MAG: glycoside hydrolase family 127 protein [Candidatus Aminicenantaceae bacterium]
MNFMKHSIRPTFIKMTVIFILLCPLFYSCKNKPKKDYPIHPVSFTKVDINDNFWLPRMETNRKITIPFAFKKCEETGRIRNFSKAGNLISGEFEGIRYNDSDVYKIMEGAAYSLSLHRDPELEQYMDDLIEKIAAAQEKDGYLYTTRTIDPENPTPGAGDERWSNLGSSHELYNVGHMYEAAVAYFQATGKRNFLNIAIKNANFIADTFGPGKKQGFPGHQEIEIGLVKLYRVTGNKDYLDLAQFFLDVRGPNLFKKQYPESSSFSIYNQNWYLQAHKPVIEQKEAIGHAVRAAYMYSGMADIAALTGNKDYLHAIDRIWENVVSKKLYITGGIGSRHKGESFGDNYELPNATAYNETCAAIANVFWNHRLSLLHGDSKYTDVLELTLYNGLISGISLRGNRFFYPNPLESNGKYKFNQGATTRKPWFDCACCPVNIARFIPSIPGYIYAKSNNSLYINLFVEGKTTITSGKNPVTLIQKTRFPWKGEVLFTINPEEPEILTINIRIPGWAQNKPVPSDLYTYLHRCEEDAIFILNSDRINPEIKNGYASIQRKWNKGDKLKLILPMPVRRVIAHEKVKENRGKVAIQRGPLIYCFEGVDNDGHVLDRKLPDNLSFKTEWKPDLLGGIIIIKAVKQNNDGSLTAIPYYAWSHRGTGEMAVWLPRK